MIDQAIRLRASLDALAGETWVGAAVTPPPAKKEMPASVVSAGAEAAAGQQGQEEEFDPVRRQLDEVADEVARLRQVRVVLAIVWQHAQTGRMPGGFSEIKDAEFARAPRHPSTCEELGWKQMGATDVLAFASARRQWDASVSSSELLWRLPERK